MKAYVKILLLTLMAVVGLDSVFAQAIKQRSDIDLNGNKVTTSVTNGDIVLQPNGTGTVRAMGKFDADNLQIDGNTIYSTNTNGDIWFVPNGSGEMKLSNQLTIFNNAGVLITDDDGSHYARLKSTHALTGNREVKLPDASTTLVGTDAAQVLTSKDIDGGSASNSNRLTVPKNTKTNLDALTRKEGTVVYATDQSKLFVDNGSTLTAVGSGSGAGEINAVTNPNAETDLTGYADSDAGSDVTRDTTAANLALYPTITSGVKVNADAATEYISYCGTMPAGLKNRKLKLEWFQVPESGYASGDQKLEVYSTTSSTCSSSLTRLALSTDASGVTAIPNATGKYTTTADTNSDGYFQIRWVRVSGTKFLTLQNIIYGPGIQPQGYAGGEYEETSSFTIAGSTSNPTPGTNVMYRRTTRDGEYAIIRWEYYQSGAGSAGSGDYLLPIPAGLTINYSKIGKVLPGSNPVGVAGSAKLYNGTHYLGAPLVSSSGAYANKIFVNVSNDVTTPTTWGSSFAPLSGSVQVSAEARVPIAEWAGGSAYLAQSNAQEVAIARNASVLSNQSLNTFNQVPFNTEEVDTANSFASNTFTARTAGYFRVDVSVTVAPGTNFTRTALALFKNNATEAARFYDESHDSTTMWVAMSGSTVIKLEAGDYINAYTYATGTGNYVVYGAANNSQTRIAITRVSVDGSVIGFGAATATQMGLYQAGQAPGTNTNNDATAGNVGEYVDATGSNFTSATSASTHNIMSTTLTPGDWDVWGYCVFAGSGLDATTEKLGILSVETANNTLTDPNYEVRYLKGFNISDQRHTTPPVRIKVASGGTQTVYLNGSITNIAGTAGSSFGFYNPRIRARRAR